LRHEVMAAQDGAEGKGNLSPRSTQSSGVRKGFLCGYADLCRNGVSVS
jgi:hypothetical protein